MRLIVVRHAKSSWSQPALSDHDRPLAPRGIRSANLIGAWLAEKGYMPRHVMCSSARRTQETWKGISRHAEDPPILDIMPKLYHAGLRGLIGIAATAKASPVMLIGHNPGIGEFANWVCSEPPGHIDFRRYPTGATLVCDIDPAGLSELTQATGLAVAFTVPRDLD